MKTFIIIAVLVSSAIAQYVPYAPQEVPIPYSFNYMSPTEDGGGSGRQEISDGAGRVQGSYTVTNLEGHTRTVDYVADENGFRANVRTNEPGTANINPADVTMESSAPEGPGAISYSMGVPGAAPVAPAGVRDPGVRYVMIPPNDPRIRAYGG